MVSDWALLTLNFSIGALTLFSPCSFAMFPAYVAYYLPRGDDGSPPSVAARLARGIGGGLLAALGASVVLGSIAALALALGAPFKEHVVKLELLGGLVTIGLGVLLLMGRGPRFTLPLTATRARGALGLVAFGALYAAVAASCNAPLLLGIAVPAVAAPLPEGAALVGAYLGGLATTFVATTALIAVFQDRAARALRRVVPHVERVSGAILVLAGLYLVVYWARLGTI